MHQGYETDQRASRQRPKLAEFIARHVLIFGIEPLRDRSSVLRRQRIRWNLPRRTDVSLYNCCYSSLRWAACPKGPEVFHQGMRRVG